MLITNIKLALRLQLRSPFFTTINLVSLAIGFASFMVLWPYSTNELLSDQFHRDAEKIVRVGTHIRWTDDNEHWNEWVTATALTGAATRIRDLFSEVTDVTRIVPQTNFQRRFQGADSDVLISVDAGGTRNFFREKTTAYADPNFFRFFTFPVIRGTAETILERGNSVALSEAHAIKYFGSIDVIGKVVYLSDSIPLTVAGVFADLPANTHFKLDVLISTTGISAINVASFDWMGYNYIKLNHSDFQAFYKTVQDHREELFGPPSMGNVIANIHLEPLTDIAFTGIFGNAFPVKSRLPLRILNYVSFVILALAWINYVSISLHRLNKRRKELGTRKTVGATSRNLASQFLVETALLNVAAFFLALTIIQVAGEKFTQLFGIYFIGFSKMSAQTLMIIFSTLIFGILVTGAYPVWLSARHRPLELLQKFSRKAPAWVNWMVTFQYTAALILLIWVVSVLAQMNFILNKALGIEKANLVVIDAPLKEGSRQKLNDFLAAAEKIAGVEQITFSESVPGDAWGNLYVERKGGSRNEMALDFNGGVDENFLATYGIELLAGRNFYEDRPVDQTTALISAAAAKRLAFNSSEDALGKKIFLTHYIKEVEVVGVYKDYELRPFLAGQREDGRGSILTYKNYATGNKKAPRLSVRLSGKDAGLALEELGNKFRSSFAEDTFHWTYVEDNIQRHYGSERNGRNQIILFTAISIFVSCLGLLGMMGNRAAEKIKEIGIRKVLGAGTADITNLLVRSTAIQVAAATIIATPGTYYLVDQYLQRFSDKVTPGMWHFAIPVMILIAVMAVTISYVVLESLQRNPAQSLRTE